MFSPQMQQRHIAAELSRATAAGLRNNKVLEQESLWRALTLVDASIADPQWEDRAFLLRLREAIAALYAAPVNPALARFIMEDLLTHAQEKVSN